MFCTVHGNDSIFPILPSGIIQLWHAIVRLRLFDRPSPAKTTPGGALWRESLEVFGSYVRGEQKSGSDWTCWWLSRRSQPADLHPPWEWSVGCAGVKVDLVMKDALNRQLAIVCASCAVWNALTRIYRCLSRYYAKHSKVRTPDKSGVLTFIV